MTGFGINYRELLSCAFAVHTWGNAWASHQGDPPAAPVHVQFRIDNTSAVSWQTMMGSRNTRAQTVIRLRSHWELAFGLRFSSTHVPGAENRIADAGSRSFLRLGVGSPFPGPNKWLAAGSVVGERPTAGEDMAYYLRAHSVVESTYAKYTRALKTWFSWATTQGIQPALHHYGRGLQIQIITAFVLHGFQSGYGSGRRVRAPTIASFLHGIAHSSRQRRCHFQVTIHKFAWP
ncbi:unnamed protein product [Phytophthora fragariaefolia]|uniref:Unnamed protein product n=1 Tax=Phytophthora fragariaefolia TaxID=1490495 RepID=A0A9W6XMR1_9STRA|nr:unnamed protein product [Phytophthora fragariaefolia]